MECWLEVAYLALQSIPTKFRRHDRFLLNYPDFDYQNILMEEDCNIAGFLD